MTAADMLTRVACPYCGALPDEPCTRQMVAPVGEPLTLPHPQRVLVAVKWADANDGGQGG